MNSSPLTNDDFLTAFRTRRECCRALLELSREQQDLIAADNFAGLIELLQVKQRLVDELVGPADAPWKNWKLHRTAFSAAVQTAGDEILAETEALLHSLLAEERVGSTILTSRRDVSERELSRFHSSLQIDSAYRPAPSVGSRLGLDIDL